MSYCTKKVFYIPLRLYIIQKNRVNRNIFSNKDVRPGVFDYYDANIKKRDESTVIQVGAGS